MRKLLRLLATIGVIALSVIPLANAHAITQPTLRESYTAGGDGDSQATYTGNWTAMQFTSNVTAHSVIYLDLMLKRVGSPGTVTVSLKETSSGAPTGADLASGTLNGTGFGTSYALQRFTLDTTSISANTSYAIVCRALAGDASNYVMWQKDTGGGLANAVGYTSNNSGVTWTSATPADYLFSIYGYDILKIYGVGVFRSFYATDDIEFIADVDAAYVPYYPLGLASTYFNLKVYSANGTGDPLAVKPLADWGRRPIGVGLKADLAAAITEGDALVIKVVGTTDPTNEVATYTLTSADWYGDDEQQLKDFCIRVATNMESVYSTDFVDFVNGVGFVLNAEGGVIFDAGVPGLSIVVPSLYKTVVHTYVYNRDTSGDTFSGLHVWSDKVGAQVAADFDAIGDPFNIDGQVMAGLLGVAAWVGIGIISGSFIAGMLAAMPFAMWMVDLGAWAPEMMLIGIGIMALIIAYNLWFSKG